MLSLNAYLIRIEIHKGISVFFLLPAVEFPKSGIHKRMLTKLSVASFERFNEMSWFQRNMALRALIYDARKSRAMQAKL